MDRTKLVFLVVFFIQIMFSIQQLNIPCATPCISSNACQVSTCDTTQGVCVTTPRSPLPVSCCSENAHCSSSDLCVYSFCNTTSNSCASTPICDQTYIPKQVCTMDSQCRDDNVCTQTKCVDNVCQVSPLVNTNDPSCCRVTSDCDDSPCTEKFCNVETFKCFYTTIKGCSAGQGAAAATPAPIAPIDGSSDNYQTPSPTAGDIVGAVFGYLILGFMAFAILLVIAILLLNIILKKIFKSKEEKDMEANQKIVQDE